MMSILEACETSSCAGLSPLMSDINRGTFLYSAPVLTASFCWNQLKNNFQQLLSVTHKPIWLQYHTADHYPVVII